MHKNPLWISFIAIFSLILLWYSYDAGTKWWAYHATTATTIAENVEFTVKEESSDKFFIHGTYTFNVDGKQWHGESSLLQSMYRNHIAANEIVPDLEKKQWTVWYSPTNPKYSTLQKTYPFKECLYAGVLWALLIYFLYIGWRVKYCSSHNQR